MHTYPICLLLLALAVPGAQAMASNAEPSPARGLHEIPDNELGAMRGRYIVGDNRIAWFGVTMVSTWMTASGQQLQGSLSLGFDLRGGRPVVSFEPSVTVTGESADMASIAGIGSVNGAGLANVSGLVQGVQVAGNGNFARNGLSLRIRDGQVPEGAGTASIGSAEAGVGDAHARAALDADGARVLLQVRGQGAAEQWIDARSIGQSIRLGGDANVVANRLELDLVRQSVPASQTIHQNLVQAIGMTRGGGI